MPRLIPIILLLLFLSSCQPQGPQTLPPIEVHFSPKGDCTEAVVDEINAAQSSIFVQAYSFTSAPIAKALVDAHNRGVKIQVILDKSQRTEKYSSADFVRNAGIPTFIDSKHAIAHNKIMVIDGGTIITGSFNFTKAAEESNAENLLVIRSSELATKYTANWKDHADHSELYARESPYNEIQRATTMEDRSIEQASDQAGGYVASINSEIFHRSDCKSASKISEKNLVRFGSRSEAIRAGKKPCEECEP